MSENGIKKLKTLFPIVIWVIALVSSYSFLQWQSVSHGQGIKQNEIELKEQGKKDIALGNNIIELKQDVKYMREDIGEIKMEQKENKILLMEILSKI